MSIKSINPFNGELIRTYIEDSKELVAEKIKKTHNAWRSWRKTSFKERGVLMNNLAEKLRERKTELAKLMALEMGKPIKEGVGEIEKCALVCEYYAKHAEAFLEDQLVKTDASRSYISFQPIGIVLAIMPWNFPFWQVFRFLAPGLMAGNCGLLKHASNVPGCALAIEELVTAAGFPAHVFQTLLVGSASVSEIIANPLVKAVTLTGSTEAGIKVAEQSGKLLKKTVLELGGSDPYIVLEDADLELAAQTCADSRLINNGQSCVAAKRFILLENIEEEFTKLFVEKMKAKINGNPLEAGTDLGPMARTDLRDELHQQVKSNIAAGATCILGGDIPDLEGAHAFYQATVLSGLKKGMPAYSEEIFGPVASIFTAKTVEEAIEIANDTTFGLGAAIFTRDVERGEAIAKNGLEAGCCFVNSLVKSDPRLPFGGINQSGYGRELSSFGIQEFVNIKTVYVK